MTRSDQREGTAGEFGGELSVTPVLLFVGESFAEEESAD
jgi:hypothetical protein